MLRCKFNRPVCVSVCLLCFFLSLGGCAPFPANTPRSQNTPSIAPSRTTTPALPTITPTPSRTATATPFASASAAPQLSPTPTLDPVHVLPLIAQLGKGVIADGGVALSPDGESYYVMLNGELLIYNADSLQEIGTTSLSDNYIPGQIYFSKDTKFAAIAAAYGAGIFDLNKGTFLGVARCGDVVCRVTNFVFSSDDRFVVYRGGNGYGEGISFFDLTTGKDASGDYFPFPYNFEYDAFTAPAISPDNQWVAAGCSNKTVYLWNAQGGGIYKTLQGHTAGVTSVAFSPDGTLLASGSDDGIVRLWNPKTGSLVSILSGFSNAIETLAFSPDGKLLNVSVKGQLTHAWDLNAGRFLPDAALEAVPTLDPLTRQLHRQGYSDIASLSLVQYSPDGRLLAAASRIVQLWDAANHSLIQVLEGKGQTIRAMAFRPDGNALAALDQAGNILVWNTRTGQLTQSLHSLIEPGGHTVFGWDFSDSVGLGYVIGYLPAELGLAFSPDGTRLSFANGYTIEVWDISAGQKLWTLPVNTNGSVASSIAFSKDGKYLYAELDLNRSFQVWNLETGKLLRQIDMPSLHEFVYTATALEGNLFAKTACENESEPSCWIELWNLETGTSHKLPVPSWANETLRFSPDGRLLVTVDKDWIYFWKTDTGQLVNFSRALASPLVALGGGNRPQISISPDLKTLAVYNGFETDLYDISRIAALVDQANPPTVVVPSRTPTMTPEPRFGPSPTNIRFPSPVFTPHPTDAPTPAPRTH